MCELPTFSIIVPTYQRHAQLAACLAALAALDYPHEFEVVVVDDGSRPRVDAVCEPFRASLALKLVAQENAGPAAARNLGATIARGALLVFTDDDCCPAPDYLRSLAARFRESPAALVGGRTINALAENPYSATSQLIIETVYEFYNASPSGDATFFASNNFALPADAFRDAGGFDERFRCSEDRDFCERWRMRGGALVYEPEAVVRHAHALSPVSLWRQHFGYGRGAFIFHEKRGARTGTQFKPDPAFYMKLLRAALAQPRAALMTLLLAWAQAANAAGYARQRFASSPANWKRHKFDVAES